MRDMKKTVILNVFVGLLAGGALSSCTDFFEVEPYQAVVEEGFYKTQEDLNAFALGMYAPLSKDAHKFLLWGDARADMVTTGEVQATPYINEFVINNVSIQNPYADYANIYQTIARCNRQMERVYDVLKSDDKLFERSASAYYAEDISYIDEGGNMINRKTSSVSANELRGLLNFAEDKQEVWQMIYNDALTVLGMLPLNFQWNKISLPSEERYGRVSQPTAATF